jgi:alanyl-tRNA synthetase
MTQMIWKQLPDVRSSDETKNSFYSMKSIEEIAKFMEAVINEWNKKTGKDESVREKELPLINAFREKISAENVKNFQKLLNEFEICDDERAVKIARELQGKKKHFPFL